jgi:hypothetical protein
MSIASETRKQMGAVVYYSVCRKVIAKEKTTYTAKHKYYHNNFSMKKQNSNMQPCKQGGSAT